MNTELSGGRGPDAIGGRAGNGRNARRVDDQRTPIGLGHDCAVVKPPNADGLVNWLTTHLINALRHPAVMRTRARIESVAGVDICRVDVAKSSVLVRAKMSDKDDVFWVRINNTTHAWPEDAIEEYVREHWPTDTAS